MRRLLTAAAAFAALSAPLGAAAQDAPAAPEAKVEEMAKAFADPDRQREMALMLRAVSEIMLDLPVAPMLEAMQEVTGEKRPKVAPDATLRSLSPDAASRVPELIEKGVPTAMTAMGGAAKGAAAMTPAMREMAAKMAPMLRAMAESMDKSLKGER